MNETNTNPDAEAAFARIDALGEGRHIGDFKDFSHVFEVAPGVTVLSMSPVSTCLDDVGRLAFFGRGPNSFIFLGLDIQCPMVIRANGSGNVFFFGSGSDLCGGSIIASGSDNTVFVGAGTTMDNLATIVVHGPEGFVSVGERCTLREHALLSNSDAHGIYDSESGRRLNFDRPVIVQDEVHLGRHVLVGKGVTIEARVHVCDGAVVHRDISAGQRVAGNPAKPIARDAVISPRPSGDLIKSALSSTSSLLSSPLWPARTRNASLLTSLAALADLTKGRRVDPVDDYKRLSHSSGVGVFLCDDAKFEPVLIDDRGDANSILVGSKATPGSLSVLFDGSDNIIFFGPASRAYLNIIITGNGNRVYIGADCIIVGATLVVEGHSKTFLVGDRCLFSSAVLIGDAHEGSAGDVMIGDDVWIGRYAILQNGTVVGPGAIIGHGAVASGELAGRCIYAGAPAQKRREGIVWNNFVRASLEEARAVPEERRRLKQEQADRRAAAEERKLAILEERAQRDADRLAQREAAIRVKAERESLRRANEEARQRDRQLKLAIAERTRAAVRARREAAELLKAERNVGRLALVDPEPGLPAKTITPKLGGTG